MMSMTSALPRPKPDLAAQLHAHASISSSASVKSLESRKPGLPRLARVKELTWCCRASHTSPPCAGVSMLTAAATSCEASLRACGTPRSRQTALSMADVSFR